MKRVHATSVARPGPDGPQAVLLRGPSGSGKSDLALRLIDDGWELVADDYTELSIEGGELIARAPDTIEGLIEARGIGIVRIGAVPRATVAALFDLVELSAIERLPEADSETLLGHNVPRYRLHGFDASAPAKVRLALRAQAEKLFSDPAAPPSRKPLPWP